MKKEIIIKESLLRNFLKCVTSETIYQMKVNGGLTEHIINDVIDERLPLLMNEMAHTKKQIEDRAENNFQVIIPHWCLAYFGMVYGNINYSHWKQELMAFIENVQQMRIKSGDKFKAICHRIIDVCEYDNFQIIYNKAEIKLYQEGITDKEVITPAVNYFTNNLLNIIRTMSDEKISVRDFINQCFPDK